MYAFSGTKPEEGVTANGGRHDARSRPARRCESDERAARLPIGDDAAHQPECDHCPEEEVGDHRVGEA
jgi:hypothetical protein